MILKIDFFGYIGRKIIYFFNNKLELAAFFYRLLIISFKSNPFRIENFKEKVTNQIWYSGIKSLPITFITAFGAGSLFIIQFTAASEIYNIGRINSLLIWNEIAPLTTALIVIMRSASFLTLEMHNSGISSIEEAIRKICLSKMIGIIIASICLTTIFNITALIGGYIITKVILNISLYEFIGHIEKFLTFYDIIFGIFKAFCFGIIISIVCFFNGLKKINKKKEIFSHISDASIQSFLFCVFINIAISIVNFSFLT